MVNFWNVNKTFFPNWILRSFSFVVEMCTVGSDPNDHEFIYDEQPGSNPLFRIYFHAKHFSKYF